jgi:hypothetical protein
MIEKTDRSALMFWSRLIQAAAGSILALSALLLLAPTLGAAFFNLVYYQQAASPVNVPAPALSYIHFANGVIGAVMAGWMIAIIMLAKGPFAAGQSHAWNTIAVPLAGWFVIDMTFSLAHGIWGNVLLNAAVAAMFAIPLIASRRYFNFTH